MDEVYANTLVEVEAVDESGGDQCYAEEDGGNGNSDDSSGRPGVNHLQGGRMTLAAYVASISQARASYNDSPSFRVASMIRSSVIGKDGCSSCGMRLVERCRKLLANC